jgi:hypothetical protein
MVIRFGLALALAGALAACTDPTAPRSAAPTGRHMAPMQSAGTLIGSDT